MDLVWIFLPLILALGAVTSYEDIKKGKIRNKWVVIAIITSIAIHAILLLSKQISAEYATRISLLTLFSLITGFALFVINIWSAGDAKLFTAYISLYPLTSYGNITTSFWPMDVLANTILPIFIFLTAQSILKLKKEQFFLIAKKIFNPKMLAIYLLTIFSISWIVLLVFGYFNIQTNFMLNIIGIMTIMWTLKKLFPSETLYILILIAILRIFVNQQYMMRLTFWQSMILMTMAYALVIFFIREVGELYTKKANINFLKKGMMPSQFIMKYKGQYVRTDKFYPGMEKVYEKKPEGLDENDIKNIQRLHRKGYLHFNTIKIQQTLPFAPFMLAGTILTLLVKGNIIIWIRSLF